MKTNSSYRFLPALLLLFVLGHRVHAQKEKFEPSIKLSYKFSDSYRGIKAEVTYKDSDKTMPAKNLIVNMYLNEVKKFYPPTGEGWMTNMLTDDNGVCEFNLTEQFKRIKTGAHQFTFTARFASDPRFEDTQESIVVNDVKIDLSLTRDSLTTATAKLIFYQDSLEVPAAKTEMKLGIRRTFSLLPFGDESLTTDESGVVSAEMPGDVPGDPDKTITVVARYEDMENDGIIEVSKRIPWSVLPKPREFAKRTLWSTGSNAPVPLVIISTSIIIVIWGVIFYLVFLLLRIRKMR